MRDRDCVLVLTILANVGFTYVAAQTNSGYYPLQNGNVWQYYEPPPPPPGYYGWTSRAVRDTILPNGLQYKVLEQDIGSPEYLRQDGPRVYGYGFRANRGVGDVLMYDFSRSPGDTVAVHITITGDTMTTLLTSNATVNFYGRHLRYMRFVSDSRPNRFLIVRDVIDSVGLAYLLHEPGEEYYLRGAIIDGVQYGPITSVTPNPVSYLEKFKLHQNFPNPFNPSTRISYVIPQRTYVQLKVFDLLGREVATLVNEEKEQGFHAATWNAQNSASGVYFYRLETTDGILARGMVLQK